jgi:hypothetical protein
MHVIRLRSAWEALPAGSSEGIASAGQRFQRSFGRPTNLGHERVFLAIEPVPTGAIELNGELLQRPLDEGPLASRQFRQDVTPLLATRNQLVVTTNSTTFDHEVRLEIVE